MVDKRNHRNFLWKISEAQRQCNLRPDQLALLCLLRTEHHGASLQAFLSTDYSCFQIEIVASVLQSIDLSDNHSIHCYHKNGLENWLEGASSAGDEQINLNDFLIEGGVHNIAKMGWKYQFCIIKYLSHQLITCHLQWNTFSDSYNSGREGRILSKF